VTADEDLAGLNVPRGAPRRFFSPSWPPPVRKLLPLGSFVPRYEFVWDRDIAGYYDYLGRAFAGGHLYLTDRARAQLLAQRPQSLGSGVDDALNCSTRADYSTGAITSIHGAGPAVMLFTPWRLLPSARSEENGGCYVVLRRLPFSPRSIDEYSSLFGRCNRRGF